MRVAETASAARYHLREFHSFEAAGTGFVYLVLSGAIFALDKIGSEIVERIRAANPTREELVHFLVERGYSESEIKPSLKELQQSSVIIHGDFLPKTPKVPVQRFPLQQIVLNTTNQCNLA